MYVEVVLCVLARSVQQTTYMLHVGGFNSFDLNWQSFSSRLFCAAELCRRSFGSERASVEQVTSGSLQSNQSHNGLKKCHNPNCQTTGHVLCEAEFKPTAHRTRKQYADRHRMHQRYSTRRSTFRQPQEAKERAVLVSGTATAQNEGRD